MADYVLIHPAAITEIPQAGWLTNDWNSLLTVWSLGSPRSRRQHTQCLVGACFLVYRHRLPSESSQGRKGEGALWGLFCQGPNPIM